MSGGAVSFFGEEGPKRGESLYSGVVVARQWTRAVHISRGVCLSVFLLGCFAIFRIIPLAMTLLVMVLQAEGKVGGSESG